MGVGNSYVKDAEFVKKQIEATSYIQNKFSQGRQLVSDALGEPILWAQSVDDAFKILSELTSDNTLKFDYLTDITAYDNVDGKDGPKRFIVVYQIFSTIQHTRLRIKVGVDKDESPVSITSIWNGANWLEREVYDMFGIKFKNHPNMRRILMDERFSGYPLRKEYPLKRREPFADNVPLHLGAHAVPKQK